MPCSNSFKWSLIVYVQYDKRKEMPTKPIDSKKIKKKKRSSSVQLLHSKPKVHHEVKSTSAIIKPRPPIPTDTSVGFGDRILKEKRIHRRKSRYRMIRHLFSFSLITYVGYYFLRGCGSPFDDNSKNMKPVICQAIDPIKIDLYNAYHSEFYKNNIDPVVIQASNWCKKQYESQEAIQKVVKNTMLHYNQYCKPLVQEGAAKTQSYVDHTTKTFMPIVDPYIEQLRSFIDKANDYTYQVIIKQQLMPQIQIIKDILWHQLLPLPLRRILKQTYDVSLEWFDKAENMDMMTFLTHLEHAVINFYQHQLMPHYIRPMIVKVQERYDDLHLEEFVDRHLKPAIDQLYDCATPYYDVLWEQMMTWLPSLPPTRKSLAKSYPALLSSKFSAASSFSTVSQTKTSIPVASVIPLVSVTSSKQAPSESSSAITANPASSFLLPPINYDTETQQKDTSVTSPSYHLSEATIDKYDAMINNTVETDIIRATDKVSPTVTPISTAKAEYEYVDMDLSPPEADKKEAIYCPTCNPDEEQIIVAAPATEKEIRPVMADSEKQIFEVNKGDGQIVITNADKDVRLVDNGNDKKQVFEVHREQKVFIPPQSPTNQLEQKANEAQPSASSIVQEAKKQENLQNETDVEEKTKTKQAPSSSATVSEKEDRDEETTAPENNDKNENPSVIEAVVGKSNVKISLPIEDEEASSSDDKVMSTEKEEEDTYSQETVALNNTEEAIVIEEVEPIIEKIVYEDPIVPDDESQFTKEEEKDSMNEKPTVYKDGVSYEQVEKIFT
ncbi:MAG: hypothetical protein EXX96DRAFT_539457 [Benjaminiella poitrasii]|nr:MAG: hypothetical protein EXX96DRAFT_539457 [Benjaminiella poitrasii]